jgi:hypothetical protein
MPRQFCWSYFSLTASTVTHRSEVTNVHIPAWLAARRKHTATNTEMFPLQSSVRTLLFPQWWALCYKLEGCGFDSRSGYWFFFQLTKSFQWHYGLGVDSASTRNLPGSKGRPARKVITSPTSVIRLYRKCESFDVSLQYGLPRSVKEVDLPVLASTSKMLFRISCVYGVTHRDLARMHYANKKGKFTAWLVVWKSCFRACKESRDYDSVNTAW